MTRQKSFDGGHRYLLGLHIGKHRDRLRLDAVMTDERHQDNDSIRVADARGLFDSLQASTGLCLVMSCFIGEVDVHPLVLFPVNPGGVPKMMKKRARIESHQLTDLLPGEPGR